MYIFELPFFTYGETTSKLGLRYMKEKDTRALLVSWPQRNTYQIVMNDIFIEAYVSETTRGFPPELSGPTAADLIDFVSKRLPSATDYANFYQIQTDIQQELDARGARYGILKIKPEGIPVAVLASRREQLADNILQANKYAVCDGAGRHTGGQCPPKSDGMDCRICSGKYQCY